MIEIRYCDHYEIVNVAGQSISDVREQFKAEFDIPEKATAKLNGKKVKGKLEAETCLNDDDKLTFANAKGKGALLLGALLLALVITGGIFAYTYTTNTVTIALTSGAADFANVAANTSDLPTWTTHGSFAGAISGPKPIFDIDTATSNYTGDLVVSVAIANADQLVSDYRVLFLKLDIIDSSDNVVDINLSGGVDGSDFAMLTLANGWVDMFISGSADVFTVRLKSGFYITLPWAQASGYEDPVLYCEVDRM